jgi:protein-disulfide isomerase
MSNKIKVTKPGGPARGGRRPPTTSRSPRAASSLVRTQIAREQARRRTLLVSGIAVAVLVIAGLIGWGVYASQRPTSYVAPQASSSLSNGIVVGGGPATVDLYVDFQCPHCKEYEQAVGPTLTQMVDDKKIRIVYHPIAILDDASSTQYSTRSSGAFACAANLAPDKVIAYAEALFAQQPPEGGSGLTDDKLISIANSVGITDPALGTCVRDGTYRSWTAHVTEAATDRGVNGTPTVFVNGKEVEASLQALTAAVGV